MLRKNLPFQGKRLISRHKVVPVFSWVPPLRPVCQRAPCTHSPWLIYPTHSAT